MAYEVEHVKQLKISQVTSVLPEMTEWLKNTPEFDPRILTYPTLRVLCAYNEHGTKAYLPSQLALVLESVGKNPDADRLTMAQALRDLVKGKELIASQLGVREIYFIGTDSFVADMASGQDGFEVLKWPVLRMKL